MVKSRNHGTEAGPRSKLPPNLRTLNSEDTRTSHASASGLGWQLLRDQLELYLLHAGARCGSAWNVTDDMGKSKILVVDDNQVVLKAMEQKLRSEGFDVTKAAEAAEAFECARYDPPDLILLDINFPPDVAHGGRVVWDGFSIAKWIRQRVMGFNAPIIMITATDVSQLRDKVMDAGVAGIFQKPINPKSLLMAIQNALNARKSSPPKTASSPALQTNTVRILE